MEGELSHEQQFELQMELNASYERLDDLATEQRILSKKVHEEQLVRDAILKAMGLRAYDVT